MGIRSSLPEENKNNLNNSIDGGNKTLPLMTLESNEKKAIQMRFSINKRMDEKELRQDYFRRLSRKNKKENDERQSTKALQSYGRISVIEESNKNKNDSPFEEYNENPLRCSVNLNHSYVEKSVNLSLDESIIRDELNDSGNLKNHSRHSTPRKKIIHIDTKNSQDINSRNSKGLSHHKSLSDNLDLPIYSETRNSLFLQNDMEININDDDKCDDKNIISMRKRIIMRRGNLSSCDVSMYREDIPDTDLINDTKDIDNNISIKQDFNDSISFFSNRNPINLNNYDYELKYVKNGEEIRRSYIAKLIYKKVWQPSKKEKDHNSLILFDWDDTLLCTSFLTPNGLFNEDIILSDKDHEKLAKLEFSVLRLLTAAIGKGDTYIITNAAPGWVEYSAERFYPSVKKVLEKITIISARGEYESKYPGDSRMWKIQAFLNMQKLFNYNLVTNIICLGDSFIEMEAAHVLASKFTQAFIKTIKFRESPKPEELNKQLSLVADQFPIIYSTIKNLTIRVEKKVKR